MYTEVEISNLYEIISQIQKDLFCPVCGKKYGFGEIRLKGLINNTLTIQTICENNHVALFMTNFVRKKEKALTTDEMILLHKALNDFNGDFTKLWKN